MGKRKEYICRGFKNLMSVCKGHGVNTSAGRASEVSSASIQGQFDSSMVIGGFTLGFHQKLFL